MAAELLIVKGVKNMPKRLLLLICILLCTVYFSGVMQSKQLPYISLCPDSLQAEKNDVTPKTDTIRIAIVSSASARKSFIFYQDFVDYFEQKAGLQVELILRENYNIANGLVCEGSVDLAFISSFSYVLSESNCNYSLLLRPIAKDDTPYCSCIIVRGDSDIQSLKELRGKTFTFTDPLSTLGRLYPLYLLTTAGESSNTFFENVYYASSTDYALHSLDSRLVEGAAINSLVLQSLNLPSKEFASRFKIIHQSEPFPLNPLVVNTNMHPDRQKILKNILLTMHEDNRGAAILHDLGYSHFVAAKPADYDRIREMVSVVKDQLP